MIGLWPVPRAVSGALFAGALLCAATASAQESAPAAAPIAEAEPIEQAAPLEGSQLYLAQVVGQLGAEALLGSAALCPAISWAALVAAPFAGVLAADWVGREMGLRTGSQIAAIAGNYLIACTGVTAIAGGAVFVYLVLAIGLPLGIIGGTTAIAIAAVLAAGGAIAILAGAIALLARPFLTPLLWSAFSAGEQVHADDVPDARDRVRRDQRRGQP